MAGRSTATVSSRCHPNTGDWARGSQVTGRPPQSCRVDLRMARFENPLPPEGPPVPASRARLLLRRSLLLARPEWRGLLLGGICLLLGSATSLIFPQAIRMLVDGAITKGARGAI